LQRLRAAAGTCSPAQEPEGCWSSKVRVFESSTIGNDAVQAFWSKQF